MKPNIVCQVLLINLVKGYIISDNHTTAVNKGVISAKDEVNQDNNTQDTKPEKVFDGVYSECLVYMSYVCLQNKTMVYINELNKLNEVVVLGDYVKFVKVNNSNYEEETAETTTPKSSEELSMLIDKAVNKFFNNHVLKFNFLGRDVTMPQSVEEFAGRKRKGGGGGGGGGGHMHDDGGKKKMMMMAMMCMKMKLMMMMPAMMGMMGMMSFKGMMFSMMSFMISKMMLLMKILEKKGGGGGGGGGDGGWAAAGGGGGGGAWMPAGQDGGGGYDANGQWQSRSIFENLNQRTDSFVNDDKPTITYVTPVVRHNNYNIKRKPISIIKKLNNEVIRMNQEAKMRDEIEANDSKVAKSRKRRGIVDVLQNAYIYWLNRILGNSVKYYPKYPRYKVMHGMKYVYYPITVQKVKTPKELTFTEAPTVNNVYKPINYEDFNKGEIVETPEAKEEERSMTKKKIKALSDAVNEAIEANPWE